MRDCFKFCLAPSVYKDKKDAKIGDIVLKDGSIVSSDQYKSTMSEPIGIVVSSSGNKVKMMALDFFKDGNIQHFTFGGYKDDNGTTVYHEYSQDFKFFTDLIEDVDNNSLEFPSNGFEGVRVEGTKYHYKGNKEGIPYSYLTNSVEEPEYAIQDMDGKTNTQNLLNEDLEDDMEDFNPIAIALLNSEDVEWYIPAIGELTKAFMHLNEINKTRKKLGLEELGDLDGDSIWSSTLKSNSDVWVLELYHGVASFLIPNDSQLVLLFAEI